MKIKHQEPKPTFITRLVAPGGAGISSLRNVGNCPFLLKTNSS